MTMDGLQILIYFIEDKPEPLLDLRLYQEFKVIQKEKSKV